MKEQNYISYLQIDQLHQQNIIGSNIGIAILDTGSYAHQDLQHLCLFKDYIHHRADFYDDNGHGTHVAGIINSQKCGVAPGANLFILKVLDQSGQGKTSNVLRAIDWVIENKEQYNIRIINISIGTIAKPATHQHPLVYAVERAWDNGIIVICAAGNLGPKPYTVTSPGTSPKVITVGTCDDLALVDKKPYSGNGPTTACVKKPDIVAPGSNIISCKNNRIGYTKKSGTSMATPFVSGCLALLLQQKPHLTPKEVKLLLYETSIDLSISQQHQGWGLINPVGLLH